MSHLKAKLTEKKHLQQKFENDRLLLSSFRVREFWSCRLFLFILSAQGKRGMNRNRTVKPETRP